MADAARQVEVVVKGISIQSAGLRRALDQLLAVHAGRTDGREALEQIAQTPHLLRCGVQRIVGQAQLLAIVSACDQEVAHRQWIVSGRGQIAQGREPARALRHLRPCRVGEVLGVQPDARELLIVGRLRLGDLVLMVGKHQVHTTSVDVERLAQVALAHR